MKICKKCKHQVMDNWEICPWCNGTDLILRVRHRKSEMQNRGELLVDGIQKHHRIVNPKKEIDIAIIVENNHFYSGGRYFAYQVLKALQYLGKNVVLYTNMRPVFEKDFIDYLPHKTVIVGSVKTIDIKAKTYISFPTWGGDTAEKLSKKYNGKCYLFVFDPLPLIKKHVPDDYKMELKYFKPMMRAMKSKGVNILAISEYVRKASITWLKNKNVTKIEPVVNSKVLKRVLAENNEKENWICAISRVVDRKNFIDVLKAFKPFSSDYRLKLITSTTGGIQEHIQALGLTDSVDLILCVNDETKFRILSKCKAMINTTRFEGFGMWLCLLPDEMIVTDNGMVKIIDINVGDNVLTHNGRFRKVTSLMNREINENIFVLKAVGLNQPLKLTGNHEVYAFKRPPKKSKGINWSDSKPEWIPASELEKGDCIVMPIPEEIEYNKTIDLVDYDNKILHDDKNVWYKMAYSPKVDGVIKTKRYVDLNEKLATLFGYYTAEGSTTSITRSIEFSFHEKEVEYAQTVIDYIKDIFGSRCSTTLNPKNKSRRVHCSSTILAKLFSQECGMGSGMKKIPKSILYGDVHNLKSYIQALLNGDGHKIKNGFEITTKSRQLANDIVIALIRLGEKPRISRYKDNVAYKVGWSKGVKKNGNHSNKSWWSKDKKNIFFLISDVSMEKYNGNVYNFSVEEDESYVTWGATVHNCESLACGVPCVCYDYPTFHEIINEQTTDMVFMTEFTDSLETNIAGLVHGLDCAINIRNIDIVFDKRYYFDKLQKDIKEVFNG